MALNVERQQLVARVRSLLAAQRIVEAEQVLLRELTQPRVDADLFELLGEFYVETQRPAEAATALARCIELQPERSSAYFSLAEVLDGLGRVSDVVDLYTRMCAAQPDLAIAHFNRAVYLRRAGRLEDAVDAYRQAIALRVDGIAEAWSNLGVVYGDLERHAEARAALEQAIAVDPRWIPAFYNLGLLHEEFGEREAALERFRRVLEIDGAYHTALARIVHLQTFRDGDDPLIERVRATLNRDDLAASSREALWFALGKALDDCGKYDDAFTAYRAGNAVTRARGATYDRAATERDSQAICEHFGPTWLQRANGVSSKPMLFICGMFRSGTTLLERMLSGHPALTPGGEIGYFNAQLGEASGFPNRTAAADDATLRALGLGYLDHLARRFPGAERVIDKRPDNFRYIGLLCGLFPNARFVVMQRDPLDTSLSILFEQLDERIGYSTRLDDIAHYLVGYRTLLAHWKRLLPERILDVQYERLVADPETELRRVCDFLELAWDSSMLDFEARGDRVRTASVWQVRQPLHTRSVGRWRNYASHLSDVAAILEAQMPDEH